MTIIQFSVIEEMPRISQLPADEHHPGRYSGLRQIELPDAGNETIARRSRRTEIANRRDLREVAEKQTEINAIAKDQERMRENLRALGKTERDKQLVQRYVGKIAQCEDQLEKLRQEEMKLLDEKNNLQRLLDERVKKPAMDNLLN
ncbi:MAG: hypothetical protein J2P21_15575 [Chloracidobacterium sp.]|nr:hypothetical protein [Chloracidobacterium sp.]